MDARQLADWVDARMCGPCRQGYTCDDYGCDQATKIADILKRMVPAKGKDRSGARVRGWFLSE